MENIADGEVVGGVQAIAAHPTQRGTVWIGAVNGGVWRTDNGLSPTPSWHPLTDNMPSLSIGALDLDPVDGKHRTLVAATGCFSSYRDCGRGPIGLLRTADSGATWVVLDGGGKLRGLDVSGVAARGSTLVISVSRAPNAADAGLWRSTDGGTQWKQISGDSTTGLPIGAAPDLGGDRTRPDRLFTVVAGRGVYRSIDTGATWKKVSNEAIDRQVAKITNARVAAGPHNGVGLAIVGSAGRLAGVFHSDDEGDTWRAMDDPRTTEGGIHPGSQGGLHLSLAVDPGEENVVYIGGDRQPRGLQAFPYPNSIGATEYTGRLFRGDASQPAGKQWVHLTHLRALGPPGGGTRNGSAPHADSREIAFAADGTLLEADDGGIYRRTNPRSDEGDWYSMNGDLQIAELHAAAWDRTSGIAIAGAQDTGTPQQRAPSHARWASVSSFDGDGGVPVVDDSDPTSSLRYSSSYSLDDLRRQRFDPANVLLGTEEVLHHEAVGSRALVPQFYTPIAIHGADPDRLVFGADNGVYESFDRGDTVTEIGPEIRMNPSGGGAVAYGTSSDPEVLYVGSGADLHVRTGAKPDAMLKATSYPGGFVVDVTLDSTRPSTAFVVDPGRVYRTADAGATWTDVTGDLNSHQAGSLRSVSFSSAGSGTVIVGSVSGVLAARGPKFTSWSRLGSDLPQVPVEHLELDPGDGTLLAATLGRGAWTFAMPAPLGSPAPPEPAPPALAATPGAIDEQAWEALEPFRAKEVAALELSPGYGSIAKPHAPIS